MHHCIKLNEILVHETVSISLRFPRNSLRHTWKFLDPNLGNTVYLLTLKAQRTWTVTHRLNFMLVYQLYFMQIHCVPGETRIKWCCCELFALNCLCFLQGGRVPMEPGGQHLPASVIMRRWGREGAHMYSQDDPQESNRQDYMNVAGLLSQCLEIKPQSGILIIILLD